MPTVAAIETHRANVGQLKRAHELRTARRQSSGSFGCPFLASKSRIVDFSHILAGRALAQNLGMPRRFVYVLKNNETPRRYYTGVTSDVSARSADHNAGRCSHTAKYRPWSVDVVIEFADERRAIMFERYLKSGSGVAFAHRHLR
jgi:predicted GIY-YIG superfamily endonuclease